MAGGSESKQESKPKDLTPSEFTGLRGPFADVLRGFMGTQQDPLANIPGFDTTPAEIRPEEQALLDQLFGLAGQQEEGGVLGLDLLQRTIEGEFLPGEAGANPFLNAAIEAAQRPTLEGLEELLTRALPGRFTQAGQFTQPGGSSAFDRAAGVGVRGASQSLADIATRISAGAFESERGRQQEAAMTFPDISRAQVESLTSNLQAQALPRLIEQFGIEQGLQEFQTRVNTLLGILGITAGTTAPNIGQVTTGTSSTKPNVTPALGALSG